MSSSVSRFFENLRIVTSGPESESGGMIDVDAAAVGEAGVDHRRRLVDAAADLGDHLVDDPAQVRVVVEAHRRLVEAALALDPDVARAVDHDLRDRVVGEQALERPVAEDVVGDLLGEPLAVVAREPVSAERCRRMSAMHALAQRGRVDRHARRAAARARRSRAGGLRSSAPRTARVAPVRRLPGVVVARRSWSSIRLLPPEADVGAGAAAAALGGRTGSGAAALAFAVKRPASSRNDAAASDCGRDERDRHAFVDRARDLAVARDEDVGLGAEDRRRRRSG